MGYPEAGKKIKELRLRSGFLQDELAAISQLSLRTIQRIENGETIARGDSLKRISKALDINLEELTIAAIPSMADTKLKEDNWALILLNFSAFGFLLFPLLGIIFPMMVWITYKNKILHVNESGRNIMKHQLFWCLLLSCIYLYIFSLKIFHLNLPVPKNNKFMAIVIAILYVGNSLAILINMLKCFKVKKAMHRFTLKIKNHFIKETIVS